MSLVAMSLVGMSLVASSGAAYAADLPRHKDYLPPPPPLQAPPAHQWGGLYVGGFAGGSFGSAAQSYGVNSSWLATNLPPLIPFVNNAGSQNLGLRGADLGFEVGYDYAINQNVVVGAAGDLSWNHVSGERQTTGFFPVIPIPFAIDQRLSSDWQASLRLRAGVTLMDNLLVYATGGPAWARFTYTTSFVDTLVPPFLPGAETENASFRSTRLGWTLGGGVEWAISPSWSVDGEYRYTQFAAIKGTGVLPLQQPVSTATIDHSAGPIRLNSLRVGVKYHFD